MSRRIVDRAIELAKALGPSEGLAEALREFSHAPPQARRLAVKVFGTLLVRAQANA